MQPRSPSFSTPALSSGTIVLLTTLYCAQGLPSGLIAHSLPVLMRQHGVDLALIGLLKLLALPWVLKAVWAPWVDRLASARLGHHRGWILPLQASVLTIVAVLALLPPDALFGAWLPVLLGLLACVNLAAATQDIATDGLAVRLLPPRWRGLGNSLQVGGYKAGMIVSGSLLLLVVGDWGWRTAVGLIAILVACMTVPVLLFPEKRILPFHPELAEPQGGPRLLWRHYRGFLARPGMGPWLLVVLTFKLGDSLGSPMIKPMLVDHGWTSAAVGQLTLVSSITGIAGALLGGLIYARLGARRGLILFGLAQAFGIAAMAWLAHSGANAYTAYGIALFEQVADGMSTVALFAMMMNQCRPEHEGADYTIQACAQVVLSGIVGSLSGLAAKWLGYEGHFLLAGLLGILALVFVIRYFARQAVIPVPVPSTAA
ncbi:MFS transporter [Noviherbaspirillum massiliense]|uniref:MFS transporter n=1 Tax=Noviherbaspirillum massiliense TaxID=1465823 RepID=UPI0002D6CB70|nr:MFS transporter [Noviherbaspirillum massiliense]